MSDISLMLGDTGGGVKNPAAQVLLSKAPHILIAGMTGGGKSVAVHSIVTQILQHSPRQANLVLIDPKRVEFGQYKGVPHLAWPYIANEPQEADQALRWVEAEMRMRFWRMERANVRSIDSMPDAWARLVVVIDELANLVLASKSITKRIVTIASMGRAAGVHLVLATQRPSADVITGLIRANVPTRICLPVLTKTESRIVLDVGGGELLEKPGDMLIRLPGQRELIKARGYYTSDESITNTIEYARTSA